MSPFRSFSLIGCALLLQAGSPRAAEPAQAPRASHPSARHARFTFACGPFAPCRPQAAPGPADRSVHPFEGTLGRPCGYRWRATPEGTRKVRVCF